MCNIRLVSVRFLLNKTIANKFLTEIFLCNTNALYFLTNGRVTTLTFSTDWVVMGLEEKKNKDMSQQQRWQLCGAVFNAV